MVVFGFCLFLFSFFEKDIFYLLLVLTLSSYSFVYYITITISFPSTIPILPTSSFSQIYSFPFSLQKRSGCPGISTEYYIASYSKTRYPYNKAEQGNPAGLIGFQKQTKGSETPPVPTIGNLTRVPGYTTLTNIQRTTLRHKQAL